MSARINLQPTNCIWCFVSVLQVAVNLREYFTSIYKVESYLYEGTSILCYTGAMTNATSLRQKIKNWEREEKLGTEDTSAMPNCTLNISNTL